MNKNVHFVNTDEYSNEEFRIYDITYLSENIILSSDIIGQLIYYEIENNINNDNNDNVFTINKKEVNQIYPIDDLDNLISIYSIDTFNNDNIILASSQGEIVHLTNNTINAKYTNLKSDKFSKVKYISENLFASGDFKGNITLFDIRQKTHIKIFKEQTEEITDILYDSFKSNFLLTSSIDSTLCVYDINKLSLYALSDKLDEELNCLMSYKNGNYILCGSGEGNVLIFNWDWFGDFKDMIKGHPEGINDMDKYNENIFFTGAEDGLIRICTMFPKGIRGVLKNKNKNKKKTNDVIKDVNKIKINKNKKNLVTCNGIDCLRIYDIEHIEFNKLYKPIDEFDFEEKDNNDNESEDNDYKEKEKSKESNEESEEKSDKDEDEEEEEDDGLEEEEEEEDDDEEEEIEEKNKEKEIEIITKEKEKNKFENDNSEECNNNNDNDNNNNIKLLNKKRKKELSNSLNSISEENNNKKEERSKNPSSDSSSESESDSDSDSSSTRKKNKKKVKKIDKKTKSLIAKEERKAFFNDL